jgi:glycosyltransferase involved in cell wall biosynthesis
MVAFDSWSAAIFAHNEAKTIAACLDSLLTQEPRSPGRVFVLVNGSRDATADIVARYAAEHPVVRPVVLPLGDKAGAWNHYVHVLRPPADVHFFVDGDVRAAPGALAALARALVEAPRAQAAGALPLTGRDRAGWSRRMVAFGRLAGALYALRGGFLDTLKEQQTHLPTGLIGEDLFLSCLVKGRLGRQGLLQPDPRLVFAADAGFAFRPLDPRRPRDWWTYGRRLVRYQVRDHQLAMLLHLLETRPDAGLPADVAGLYRQAARLPRYAWRGRLTPFDLLAVWQIRHAACRGVAAPPG